MKVRALLIVSILTVSVASALLTRQSVSPQKAGDAFVPFTYDLKTFGEVKVTTKKRIDSTDQAVIDRWPVDAPEHTCYSLERKQPLPAFEKGPRYFHPAYSFICVIPTSDSSPNFRDAYPTFSKAVENLKKLLRNKPREFRQLDELFDFPYNNAGWSFRAKLDYLEYANVRGVFFLTQYSNEVAPSPVNNEELTATFQGLSKDGTRYIGARFAVTHESLPRGIDFTDGRIQKDAIEESTSEKLHERVSAYLKKEEEKIEILDERSFIPSISEVKLVIASLRFEK